MFYQSMRSGRPMRGEFMVAQLTTFAPQVLDSLRQPMETGDVLIARANYHVRYPARFQMVAAMNPCRCGHGKASGRACGRGPNCEAVYQSRVSGPMFDRMDVAIDLTPVTPADLGAPRDRRALIPRRRTHRVGPRHADRAVNTRARRARCQRRAFRRRA